MVRTGGRPAWLTPRLRVLVLTTTGRRTHEPRRVTLGYLPDGDDFVVFATNFGQRNDPGWYHNLDADPDATVTRAGQTIPVRSRTLDGDQRAAWLAAARHANAQWRAYQHAVSRPIPVVLLERQTR